MSAPSTPCTPPPGHWPNAATRCSRSRSRRCAGSVSAPGGSARSPPPPSSCSTTSTAAPHDQQAREAVTGNGSLTDGRRDPWSKRQCGKLRTLHVPVSRNTAWLYGEGVFALFEQVGVERRQ